MREQCRERFGVTLTDTLEAQVEWEKTERAGAEILTVRLRWDAAAAGETPFLELGFSLPQRGIAHMWHPACGPDRGLRADWMGPIDTMTSISAPVFCLLGASGESRCTFALSELRQRVRWYVGLREENACLVCRARIPAELFAARGEYAVSLYRDRTPGPFEDALDSVRRWWKSSCGAAPLPVPDGATLPMYSTWYSHHQLVDEKKVEDDCRLAAGLGMGAVILDDGWQTDDAGRGYAFCGDWEPTPSKFPDMAAHVARVHAMGMKYLVWFSVPFVGIRSSHWAQFSDKLLCFEESQGAGVLDPRYPEVRRYLTDTYCRAVRDWGLDGLKLDFVDELWARPETPAWREGMDCPDVQDAVNLLMTGVHEALRAIRPDILIEFRQRYIGPGMRAFGNMFRVSDCPGDLLRNRVGVVDLRLLSGSTAVHGDPIVWNREESCENAALQLLSVLFGVVQFSVRPQELDADKRRMVDFWLSYMRENRSVLLGGRLRPLSPQLLYPAVWADGENRRIAAVYDPHLALPLEGFGTAVEAADIANATQAESLLLDLRGAPSCRAEAVDCRGDAAWNGVLEGGRIEAVPVPPSGLLRLFPAE